MSRSKWKEEEIQSKSRLDRHYGPQSQKPDLAPDVFEQLRQNHIRKLFENGKNWNQIERDTIHQSESELWHVLRNEMLTASNFGTVCRMRPMTSCAAVVKSTLFPSVVDTSAMKYGRDNEKIAIKELAAKINKEIKACGFFIDRKNPCLGATLDGLIDEDGVVEIKCPLSAEHLTAEEAIQTLPQLKSIFDKKNREKMNRNHRFFYQVQGQLNITLRDYCIFAVWTPQSLKAIRVSRDNTFWINRMLPLLTRFYNKCMLPEILDSRHNRHMPIREPRYIMEAKEEACKKRIAVNNTQNYIKRKNVTEGSKRLKLDVLSSNTATVTSEIEQDDDCIITNYSNKKRDLTEDDVARQRKVLDNVTSSLLLVKKNVLPINSKLNDESLDLFLRIVRETSCFETQSVLYLEYPHIIEPSRSDKSLQIIGGNCSDHWRCIFFDGTKLRVYDSLPGCTYNKLVDKEKNYIHLRYPTISQNNIIFEKVQTQPDGICCGIYAAAFAITIALGGNPCEEKYSNNVKCMREHFFKIIEGNKLLHFPQ